MSEKTEAQDNLRVYEIGFHIAPIAGDEGVSREVGEIKTILDGLGAVVVSEDFPRLRTLAYSLSKVIGGVKRTFNEAYFGWVKFEAEPEAAEKLKAEVEKLANVVRFLIIKTVKENTLYAPKFVDKNKEAGKKEEGEEKNEIVDEGEVDKAIEELVVE